MRNKSAILFILGQLIFSGPALAAQIWTDVNGDGEPDAAPIFASTSQILTVDVYVDSGTFSFTSYNVWTEWENAARTGVVTNQLTGCSSDPIDTFSHPQGIGIAGSQCSPAKSGVHRIGTFQIQISGLPGVVSPIFDIENAYDVFSILANESGYLLFDTTNSSSWEEESSGESGSWGEINSF